MYTVKSENLPTTETLIEHQSQPNHHHHPTTAFNMPTATDTAESSSSSSTDPHHLTEAQHTLAAFWPTITDEIKRIKNVDAKNQVLPLARIKKIMKLDEDVKMISAEAPLLFAKAAEIFIHELTLRAWVHTEDNKRRTLQRNDIAMAITKYDQFDFLIDIVPREEIVPPSRPAGKSSHSHSSASTSAAVKQEHQQHQHLQHPTASHSPAAGSPSVVYVECGLKTDGGQQMQQLQQVAKTEAGVAIPVQMGVGPAEPVQYYLQLAQQHQQALSQQQQLQHQQQGMQILQQSPPQQPMQYQQMNGAAAIAVAAGPGGNILLQQPAQVQAQQQQQQQIQLVQQIVTPSGEIQHVPIQIPQSQLNLLRMQMQNHQQQQQQQQQQHHHQIAHQPIILQTSPLAGGQQILQLQQSPPQQQVISNGAGGMFISSPTMVQHQQQQQQQQQQHQQQQQPQQQHQMDE